MKNIPIDIWERQFPALNLVRTTDNIGDVSVATGDHEIRSKAIWSVSPIPAIVSSPS